MTLKMTRTTILPVAVAAALLAGCMPVPPSVPVAPAPQTLPATPAYDPVPVAPVAPPPTLANSGLNERKPDVCGAAAYREHIGKPGSALPSLDISRSYRVVEFRGIEPQDYDPNRLVFRLDAAGNISDTDCG